MPYFLTSCTWNTQAIETVYSSHQSAADRIALALTVDKQTLSKHRPNEYCLCFASCFLSDILICRITSDAYFMSVNFRLSFSSVYKTDFDAVSSLFPWVIKTRYYLMVTLWWQPRSPVICFPVIRPPGHLPLYVNGLPVSCPLTDVGRIGSGVRVSAIVQRQLPASFNIIN